MNIPYRTRRAFRRLGLILLTLLVLAVAAWLCWVIWLERYVVYSRDGATLDFNRTMDDAGAVLALPPEDDSTVPIYMNEGNNVVNTSTELARLSGYYIDTEALKDLDTVRSQINALSAETPILIELKDIDGDFYYPTNISGAPTSGSVDLEDVRKLISELTAGRRYVIASVPAFRDYSYVLKHHASTGIGISVAGGGYAWTDDDGYYWMDLERSAAVSYVIQIVNELKVMGFDEIVLSDFDYPEADDAAAADDRIGSITAAAASVVSTCGSSSFTVSFVGDADFPLPAGRCRLYASGVAAADARDYAEATGFESPEIYVVFLTDVNDTRFDDYSVLRPLDTAH